MNAAGTNAQGCGWSVQRCESVASANQAAANVSNVAPVTTASLRPASGTVTTNIAATNPPINVAATMRPMWLLFGATCSWSTVVVGAGMTVVVMIVLLIPVRSRNGCSPRSTKRWGGRGSRQGGLG